MKLDQSRINQAMSPRSALVISENVTENFSILRFLRFRDKVLGNDGLTVLPLTMPKLAVRKSARQIVLAAKTLTDPISISSPTLSMRVISG